YVGFTGGTGGSTATQDILTWTFSPNALQAPAAPAGLGAQPASATSVALTWTSSATNQTGFHLDRATDSGFTQNLITQTLPPSPNSFPDIATGLAPPAPFIIACEPLTPPAIPPIPTQPRPPFRWRRRNRPMQQ